MKKLNKFIDGKMKRIEILNKIEQSRKRDAGDSAGRLFKQSMNRVNKNHSGILLFSLIIFFVLLSISFVLPQDAVSEEDAKLALGNISAIRQEMNESGFNVLRIDDILNDARQIYEAQKILKTRGRNPDFTRVFEYERESAFLKETAFQARDELFSLEKSLEILEERGVDVSEGEKAVNEIRQRIDNEEYEKAAELIEPAREKIAEIESSSTGLKIFYRATKRNLLDFLKENYIGILSGVFIIMLVYVLFRKRVMRFIIKRKIGKLEIRKSNLKKLIQETQKQYFQDGEISEGIYNIRVKKFAELTRDIDRQLPLLQEEMVKLREAEHKD